MRRPVVLAVLVALAVAGCGGSSSSSSSSATTSTTTTSAASTSSAPASSTSTTTSAAPSSATATSSTTTTTKTTHGPDASVHLAALFNIEAGGTLVPPAVSAPKHTTILLSIRAMDGERHAVVLETPHPRTVTAAPGRPARLVLKGLHNRDYLIKVDGSVRGRLIVGAAPGP